MNKNDNVIAGGAAVPVTMSSWPTISNASDTFATPNESLMPRLNRAVIFQRPVRNTLYVLPSALISLSRSLFQIQIERQRLCFWRVLQSLHWLMQFVFTIMIASFSFKSVPAKHPIDFSRGCFISEKADGRSSQINGVTDSCGRCEVLAPPPSSGACSAVSASGACPGFLPGTIGSGKRHHLRTTKQFQNYLDKIMIKLTLKNWLTNIF